MNEWMNGCKKYEQMEKNYTHNVVHYYHLWLYISYLVCADSSFILLYSSSNKSARCRGVISATSQSHVKSVEEETFPG